MKAPIPYKRRSRQPAGNEFLPKGYPLSYNANGTANFPPGYWSTSSGFRSIRNDGAGFTYSQYVNEFAQEAIVAPIGPVNLVVCDDPNIPTSTPWIANASVCPQLNGVGVSNRSVSVERTDADFLQSSSEELEVYPNPAAHSIRLAFNDKPVSLHFVLFIDAQGRDCTKAVTEQSMGVMSIAKLIPGLYTVLYSDGIYKATKRLSIQR
jgi:hypothetical protein